MTRWRASRGCLCRREPDRRRKRAILTPPARGPGLLGLTNPQPAQRPESASLETVKDLRMVHHACRINVACPNGRSPQGGPTVKSIVGKHRSPVAIWRWAPRRESLTAPRVGSDRYRARGRIRDGDWQFRLRSARFACRISGGHPRRRRGVGRQRGHRHPDDERLAAVERCPKRRARPWRSRKLAHLCTPVVVRLGDISLGLVHLSRVLLAARLTHRAAQQNGQRHDRRDQSGQPGEPNLGPAALGSDQPGHTGSCADGRGVPIWPNI